MIATLKLFFFTPKAVRLMPFMQTDPFSITNSANFPGNENSYSQLPCFSFTPMQVATESACPCTKCPSSLDSGVRLRSRFIKSPVSQVERLVFFNVSPIAVTRCLLAILGHQHTISELLILVS